MKQILQRLFRAIKDIVPANMEQDRAALIEFRDLVESASSADFRSRLSESRTVEIYKDVDETATYAAQRDEPHLAGSSLSPPGNEVMARMASTASLDDAVPYISVGDEFGSSGSREFAENLKAVVAIANDQGRFCSGVLIAPDLVLTARHCEVSPGDEVVFGSDYNNRDFAIAVDSVSLPAGVGETWFDGGDVALLSLTGSVSSAVATPMRLTSASVQLVGSVGTIAGYGLNGVGSSGHNSTSDDFRWGGQNIIDHYGPFGSDSDNLFAADFDDGSELANTLGGASGSNQIPLAYEAITTQGDSGSPLLVESNGELLVAGVTSGGLDINGKYGSITWWTGVVPFVGEISSAGGEFAGSVGGSADGALPPEDDHSNGNSQFATSLKFSSPSDNKNLARDRGTIGFGNVISDKDVFRFITTEAGRVIVDAKAISGGLDTIVRVQDADGTVVGQNNDSGIAGAENPNDSKLVLKNLTAGEYFVSVLGANETTGKYRLTVRSNANVGQAAQQLSNFASATVFIPEPFGPTTNLRDSIESAIDKDFYRFTATTSGRLVARTRALSGNLNTVLRVYDQERNTLGKNNNFKGSLNSKVGFDVEAGNSYYLKIGSAGSTKGDYRLSLRNESGDTGSSPFVNLSLPGSFHRCQFV